MSLDAREFRRIMGRFATGVTIVTLMGDQGPYGITVNSFTSVSLDPMLVLVCIDKQARGYDLFQPGHGFTVNVLAEDQEALSARFATKEIADRFADVEYRMGNNGAPIIRDVMAYLECRITQSYEGGDHTIFLGEVLEARNCNDKRPLLFYGGQYGAMK